MKITITNAVSRYVGMGLFMVLTGCLLTSCAGKEAFLTSSVVPAARGYVKVKKDDNKNYTIQVKLRNLAEVERLPSSGNTYIVWMDSDNENSKNIGRINSSTGFLSKSLKASFTTVSSTKPNKIFITAEDDPDKKYPATQVVLSTGRIQN